MECPLQRQVLNRLFQVQLKYFKASSSQQSFARTYKRLSSSSLYGLFLLWFVRVSRQNAFAGALSWLSIVYLCTSAWLDGFTTSQGFVCLFCLFSHQRPDIIVFQLPSPSLLRTNVLCRGGGGMSRHATLICRGQSYRYTGPLLAEHVQRG